MEDPKKLEPTIKSTIDYERQLWQARFSPCGRFLFACSYDAVVARWRIAQDKPEELLEPLQGHDAWVQCMDFSASQKRLVTADSWGKLICWDYENAKPIWSHDQAHDGWIRALAISRNGRLVATGGNDLILRVWSVTDGKLQFELQHENRLLSICFHPNGNTLMAGDLEGIVHQWNLKAKGVTRKLDASSLYQLDRIQHCGGARHLVFDEPGKYLACGGLKEPKGGFSNGLPCVLVFDFESGELVREMQVGDNSDGFVYDAQFHPDGFLMATSCAFPGKGHLWFWKPEEEKPFYSSKKIPNGRCLDLHPATGLLAMLVSNAPNGNGRQLKEGKYEGGSSKIHFLDLNVS